MFLLNSSILTNQSQRYYPLLRLSSTFAKATVQMKNYGLIKRGIDLAIALTMIVFVLSWLIPIVALLIILDSRGPVFFIQSRDGLKGRKFRCIKFRTMRPNLAAHLIQARTNDDRITRIGMFLRKSHIDELPQFFNILLGDMSFIGPRPHMHRDTAHYSRLVDNYMKRLDVKPGFTGLAQVKDLCGNTSTIGEMRARVRMDNVYVEKRNLAMDLFICTESARIALRKLGSLLILMASRQPEPTYPVGTPTFRRLRRAA
jgi:putative colanic acid biosynthesis UDP-glucose lipid carrier transferase